jgi:purine-nucleoside phosphorylase
MARNKQYNEQEVRCLYSGAMDNTSVRMLEKEMGINQFSIYASLETNMAFS